MEDANVGFVEVDSQEWQNFATEAVEIFRQNVAGKKLKFALLSPWGSMMRVIEISETIEGFGYFNPRYHLVVEGGGLNMWDLLPRDEAEGLKIHFGQGGPK